MDYDEKLFDPNNLNKGRCKWSCKAEPEWISELRETNIGVAEQGYRLNSESKPFGLPITRFRESSKQDGIVVGPVIGLVTHDSVRILIEPSMSGSVRCNLFGQDEYLRETHQIGKTIEVQANTPAVFDIHELKPKFTYAVTFNVPFFDIVHSKFTTLADQSADLDDQGLKIAIVSGNTVKFIQETVAEFGKQPFTVTRSVHSTPVSLWKNLYNQVISGAVNMIIHVGNNILIGGQDSPFSKATKNNMSESEARNLFQTAYRDAWNEPWTKHVLANCSNIMIMNETDIGNFVQSSDFKPQEQTVSQIAFDVYEEYQRALTSDISSPDDITERDTQDYLTHFSLKLTSQLALLCLDWRCAPTFRSTEEQHYAIGVTQRHFIEKTLHHNFEEHGVHDHEHDHEHDREHAHEHDHAHEHHHEHDHDRNSERDHEADKEELEEGELAEGQEHSDEHDKTEQPKEHEEHKHHEQHKHHNVGSVSGLIVVSPVRLTDKRSFIHNGEFESDIDFLLEHLFAWRSEAPRNKREVVVISGAEQSVEGGVGEIIRTHSKHQHLSTIKEYCVGPIAAPLGLRNVLSKLKLSRGSFSSGRWQFRQTSAMEGNSYGLLTIGQKYETTDKTEQAQFGSWLVAKPSFEFKSFNVLQMLRSRAQAV